MDSVRARQAAVEKKLQELEQQQHELRQELQRLPFGEAAWTAVQQRMAALEQRMAALQQERVELVRQAGECNLALPWNPGASEAIGWVQLYTCAKAAQPQCLQGQLLADGQVCAGGSRICFG
jgi:hypothetical protein